MWNSGVHEGFHHCGLMEQPTAVKRLDKRVPDEYEHCQYEWRIPLFCKPLGGGLETLDEELSSRGCTAAHTRYAKQTRLQTNDIDFHRELLDSLERGITPLQAARRHCHHNKLKVLSPLIPYIVTTLFWCSESRDGCSGPPDLSLLYATATSIRAEPNSGQEVVIGSIC
jgi:hypothetical protein